MIKDHMEVRCYINQELI